MFACTYMLNFLPIGRKILPTLSFTVIGNLFLVSFVLIASITGLIVVIFISYLYPRTHAACLQPSHGSVALRSTLQSDWSGGADLIHPRRAADSSAAVEGSAKSSRWRASGVLHSLPAEGYAREASSRPKHIRLHFLSCTQIPTRGT